MRVLCVAEKPSISKSISQILSGGQFNVQATGCQFIKNYVFNYPQTNSIYTVTSVLGHLTEHDFPGNYKNWSSCNPLVLFDAEIQTFTSPDKKSIEQNLLNQARQADMLMIWTDCDREGEHIGLEIVQVCRRAKRNITVKRARFSAIIAQQIHRAAQHPVELDHAQADAVEARIILDLRVGAAFTRMQTLALRNHIRRLGDAGVISYGPCQFPALGFVVRRWKLVESFVSSPFWYIHLSLIRNSEHDSGGKETVFKWKRGHLFAVEVAISIYAYVLSNPLARVTRVVQKGTKKWKPLPLTTVELQKSCSRLLRLAPKKILDIAERLYQQGFLSYPRTETDQFDPQFDFQSLIQKQTVDAAWGGFATSLVEGGFSAPRQGKNNDKAHPPIHPTAHIGNLTGDEKRVYEYIARRFLACCSKDAEGFQTTVEVEFGEEEFSATGLVVLEKNYLVVYPYDSWTTHELPDFHEGEEFHPSVCELREGKTSSPSLLTEADLVSDMDRNGIGTDATIAHHIETIIDRGYVIGRMEGNTKYLMPSQLGIGLIEGYDQIGLNKSLSKPQLRRETERSMIQVCERIRTKADVLEDMINQYKEMFIISRRQFEKVIFSVRRHLEHGGEGLDDMARGGGGGGDDGDGGGGRRGRRGGGRGNRGQGAAGGNSGMRRGGRDGEQGDESEENFDGGQRKSRQPRSLVTASAHSEAPFPHLHPADINATTSSASGTSRPLCDCGIPATQKIHSGESVSKGRKYWECGNNQACTFYRRDTPTIEESEVVPAKRPYLLPRQDSNISNSNRQCKCNLQVIQRTVTAETNNKGKRFWTCPNRSPQNPGCGYFEWDESQGSETPTSIKQRNSEASANTGDCFKCNQPGHWAANCPSGIDGSKKQRSSVTCFKCQQEGHIGNACPNDGNNGSGSDGGCYKCGAVGHWSNACPGGAAQSTPSGRGRGRGRGRGLGQASTRAKRGRGAKKRS